jgi:hypothetical protein
MERHYHTAVALADYFLSRQHQIRPNYRQWRSLPCRSKKQQAQERIPSLDVE